MLHIRSLYALFLLSTYNIHIFSLEKIQKNVTKEQSQKPSNKKINLNVNYNYLENTKYKKDAESLKIPEQKKTFDWKVTGNLQIN